MALLSVPPSPWIVAEGADATGNERSIPMARAMDDVLVAYGQNGEALRPGNGYPLRLIVPGWEGNVNVKWLRRIKVVAQPYMTRMESPDHTSLLPNGKASRSSSWSPSIALASSRSASAVTNAWAMGAGSTTVGTSRSKGIGSCVSGRRRIMVLLWKIDDAIVR